MLYVIKYKGFVCHYFNTAIIATLRAKCAADLDELLEFKVKQYTKGTVIPQCIAVSHSNHIYNRYTRDGGQI